MKQAMKMLADAGYLFIGQGMRYDGVWVYDSLEGVPMEQRIEFPVSEELQTGVAVGMALQGCKVVSIYPRLDFLLRAADQIVNHLDKIEAMSQGQWAPKVILRTRVGPKKPLDAGPQHTQDHTTAFISMLTNVNVYKASGEKEMLSACTLAMTNKRSSLVIEC